MIDVMGLLKEKTETQEITSKAGKALTKRNCKLVDFDEDGNGFVEIEMTFWGKQCELIEDVEKDEVIMIKGARTSNFHDHSLSSAYGSKVIKKLEQRFPPAQKLFEAWKNHEEGNDMNIKTLTQGDYFFSFFFL